MSAGGGRALYLPHDPLTSLDATAKVRLLERVERIARAIRSLMPRAGAA